MFVFVAFAFLALPFLSAAQLVPTGPGPNNVFNQGASCTISWTADTSGKWKSTFIELMTGPNSPMVHLATVAMVDGTDPTKTSFSFPCPSVTPNAPIYFYQFTAQGQPPTWTGRFIIASPSGGTSSPPNSTQPDGSPIPWGTGTLLDAALASPPPPTAPPGQVVGPVPGSASGAAPGATSSGTSAPVLTAAAPSNSSASASAPVTTSAPVPAAAPPSASASGFSTVPVVVVTAASNAADTPAASSSTSNALPHASLSIPALFAATLVYLLSHH